MGKFNLILCFCLFFIMEVFADFAVENGDRIVVYGDSITAGSEYPNYVRYFETYLRIHFSSKKFSFWNRGWSGDTTKNFSRFRRDCLKLNPTVIFISLGMNDAGYNPKISDGLDLFLNNIRKMVFESRRNNPKVRIYLISPNLYEYIGSSRRSYYPYVLWCYSREEKKLAKELGVNFLDLNRSYGQNTGLAHSIFPKTLTFTADGIHPLPNGGYLIMALDIIRGLKINSDLSSMFIQNGKIKSYKGQSVRIINVSSDKIEIERESNNLVMSAMGKYKGITYLDKSISFIECFADEFNRDILRISNLTNDSYSLKIDGKFLANVSKKELAKGINLSTFKNTSQMIQSEKLINLVGEKQILQDDFWRGSLSKKKDKKEVLNYKMKLKELLVKIQKSLKPNKQQITLTKYAGKVKEYKRYERCIKVSLPAKIAVSQNKATQEISLKVTNYSALTSNVEFFWSDNNIKPSYIKIEMKSDESQTLKFIANLSVNSSLPELLVKSRPKDGSFPSFLEEKTIPLVSTLDVFKRVKPIIIDGNLDDWGKKPSFTLDNRFTSTVKLKTFGYNDFGVDVSLSWDKSNLYLAVLVRDQDHINHFTDNKVSWDDSINILLSGFNFIFAKSAVGKKVYPKPAKPFDFAIKRDNLTTIYEISLPWSIVKKDNPKTNSKYKFNVIVNDRDSDESCKSLNWAGAVENPWTLQGNIQLK